MPYPTPAISYDPGTGPVTLAFTWPPMQKPGPHDGNSDELVAERADSITSSGIKQSITERIDVFRTLQMTFVPMTDLPNWKAFMLYALTGAVFTYIPDANNPDVSDQWTLEDTDWPPKFNVKDYAQFTLKMRKVVGDSGTPVASTAGGGSGAPPTMITVFAPHSADPDFSLPHGLSTTPTAVIPVSTSDGLLRLQDPGWDGTNVFLNASGPDVTGVVFIFA